MRRIYLDHNATTPLRPEARAAMLAALEEPLNPSSVHAEGRHGKAILENARATIARGLGASPRNVTFASCATEAANLVLDPALKRERDASAFDLLLIGAGEHPAVLQGGRFPTGGVETVPLGPDGALDLTALAAALDRRARARPLLALQAVNNETGVVQPVCAAAEMIRAAGGALICDASQAVGRLPTTFGITGADLLFFSSHKLGGPAGAAAIVAASDSIVLPPALLRGGGQEFGRRAGTENVAAIAGFAAAFSAAIAGMAGESVRLAAFRDGIERAVARIAPDAIFFGRDAQRAPNTSAFAIPGVNAQTLLIALDLAGVAVSSGSACSSGKVRESHVLAAMGATEKAAIRVSLGWTTDAEDVDQFETVLENVVNQIRFRRSAG